MRLFVSHQGGSYQNDTEKTRRCLAYGSTRHNGVISSEASNLYRILF